MGQGVLPQVDGFIKTDKCSPEVRTRLGQLIEQLTPQPTRPTQIHAVRGAMVYVPPVPVPPDPDTAPPPAATTRPADETVRVYTRDTSPTSRPASPATQPALAQLSPEVAAQVDQLVAQIGGADIQASMQARMQLMQMGPEIATALLIKFTPASTAHQTNAQLQSLVQMSVMRLVTQTPVPQ